MLTEEQIEAFNREGWLLVEDALSDQLDLQPVRDEYDALLDEKVSALLSAGRLTNAYEGLRFQDRLLRVCEDLDVRMLDGLDISYHHPVTTDSQMHTGDAIFRLITSARLLDAVESIVGPEIESNPTQHIRLMLPDPDAEEATPFHQDSGVLMPEADETPILTVWAPLEDVPVEKGCLCVVPRSNEALLTHCPGRALSIPDVLIPDEAMPVPMRVGSVLLLHRRTIHGSLPNRTASIRWSFDLRYQPAGLPTGRSAFPSFLARSPTRPQLEVRTSEDWSALWRATRDRLVGAEVFYDRWGTNDPYCA